MTDVRIQATISHSEASQEDWDAVVIGAGPAGSIASIVLAQPGRRVLLVDRGAFPREKACGCCLAHAAVQALHQLGVGGLLDAHRAGSIEAFELRIAQRRLQVPMPGGRTISRRRLDEALVEEAVRRGVQFLPRSSASVGAADCKSRAVRLSLDARRINVRARLVLAAGGLGFPIDGPAEEAPERERRWSRSRIGGAAIIAGHDIDLPRGVVRMTVGHRGYVGLAGLEDGCFAIGGAFDAALVRERGGFAAAAAHVLGETGQSVPEQAATAHWLGTPHLTRRPRRVAARRVLAIGDAAGFVEPFTGEGMTWAIQSAASAATLADAFLEERDAVWTGAVEREWTRLHQSLVRSRQLRCRAIAEALRHPLLLQACMIAGGLLPRLARAVVEHVQAPGAAITSLAALPLEPAGGRA